MSAWYTRTHSKSSRACTVVAMHQDMPSYHRGYHGAPESHAPFPSCLPWSDQILYSLCWLIDWEADQLTASMAYAAALRQARLDYNSSDPVTRNLHGNQVQ